MQSQLLRVSEFCERYAVSRATFYRLVKRGDVVLYKVGCASRIKVADAEAWLASLTSADASCQGQQLPLDQQ